jgi:Ni,Fe-hydrogenase III small subunit
MTEPLRRTYEAMPDPKVVIAVGTDAVSGGLMDPSYAVAGGVSAVVPVDIWLPGSPPPPFSILHALLLAVGRLPARAGGEARR